MKLTLFTIALTLCHAIDAHRGSSFRRILRRHGSEEHETGTSYAGSTPGTTPTVHKESNGGVTPTSTSYAPAVTTTAAAVPFGMSSDVKPVGASASKSIEATSDPKIKPDLALSKTVPDTYIQQTQTNTNVETTIVTINIETEPIEEHEVKKLPKQNDQGCPVQYKVVYVSLPNDVKPESLVKIPEKQPVQRYIKKTKKVCKCKKEEKPEKKEKPEEKEKEKDQPVTSAALSPSNESDISPVKPFELADAQSNSSPEEHVPLDLSGYSSYASDDDDDKPSKHGKHKHKTHKHKKHKKHHKHKKHKHHKHHKDDKDDEDVEPHKTTIGISKTTVSTSTTSTSTLPGQTPSGDSWSQPITKPADTDGPPAHLSGNGNSY